MITQDRTSGESEHTPAGPAGAEPGPASPHPQGSAEPPRRKVATEWTPVVPAGARLPELTIKALALGLILGALMTAANTYLGLYAGMTVSASIPAAVISMGILRGILRRGTILENNIVQTIASAGESLAAGIIFTVPALVIAGIWIDFKYIPVTLIALSGGVFSVLFMIPRRLLIVGREEGHPGRYASRLRTGRQGARHMRLITRLALGSGTAVPAIAGKAAAPAPLGPGLPRNARTRRCYMFIRLTVLVLTATFLSVFLALGLGEEILAIDHPAASAACTWGQGPTTKCPIVEPLDGDSLNVRVVGQWPYGPCFTGHLEDDVAYVGSGPSLVVIDVSDAATPSELGFILLPDMPYGIACSSPHVYVADRTGGLRIIDMSDPSEPLVVGSFDQAGYCADVAISGSYAYLLDTYGGVVVIDVSDPSDPYSVATFGNDGNRVAVSDGHAYLAADTALFVVDVSDPTNPSGAGSYGSRAEGVAVSLPYAYVAAWDEGLQVVDVSDPANPHCVGSCSTGVAARDVAVSGAHAFVIDYQGGHLQVVDVSDPTDPHIVGTCAEGGSEDVMFGGGYVCAAARGDGFRIIDVTDPTQPEEAGQYDTPGWTYGVAVSGPNAYLAEDHLRVLDVSDPANPQDLACVETPGSAEKVAIEGAHAYVADGASGLRVVDVSDPSTPYEVGSCALGSAVDVVVADAYAYVADTYSGLAVVDVSEPTNPQEVGLSDTAFAARGVAVSGLYAYTVDWGRGLRVIDVSDPSNPEEVGFSTDLSSPYGVCASGAQAYVSDYDDGLVVFDVSDPAHPSFLGSSPIAGATGVVVSNGYAYVAAWGAGLRVVDVSDPTSPQSVGYYYTPGHAGDVAMGDSYAYVASGFGGLWILEFVPTGVHDDTPGDCAPAGFRLVHSHPNPLNAYATIEYRVPWQSDVTLAVFNSLGQRISVLVDAEQMGPGRYRAVWHGEGGPGLSVMPGAYVCRLEGEGFAESGSMLLVK